MNSLSAILDCPVDQVAKFLLGCNLVRSIDGLDIICKIVETEAYDESDPASHSYHGVTPRTSVMFGPAGYAYVYFTYGMHHCLNVVTGSKGHGSAVLIRALEPLSGLELVKANRQNIYNEYMLTNGPGKICQALGIGQEFSGHDLTKEPLKLDMKSSIKAEDIGISTRIGISQATNVKWRFFIKDNPYVSRAKPSVNVI